MRNSLWLPIVGRKICCLTNSNEGYPGYGRMEEESVGTFHIAPLLSGATVKAVLGAQRFSIKTPPENLVLASSTGQSQQVI